MMILSQNQYMLDNPYVFFLISMVLTVIITFIYKGLLMLIDKFKNIKVARSQ